MSTFFDFLVLPAKFAWPRRQNILPVGSFKSKIFLTKTKLRMKFKEFIKFMLVGKTLFPCNVNV